MDYRLNQLASIEVNKKLKTSSTVADVFIYDTSLDSDGGAWREKCEGLSWYNETLNTATRGKTRKFPAVVLVVAEPTSITIYDATEADLPMWMVFNNGLGTSSSWAEYHLSSYGTQKKLTMKNGQLFSATKSTNTGYYWYSALRIISFIEDAAYRVGYANKDKSIHNIEERHTASSTIESWTEVSSHGFSLVSAIHINSIEVKILPDAPIDPTTGLPKVTIFAGNIDGCYIIKDNDEVVMGGQVSSTWSVDMLFVDDYNRLWGTLSNNASFGGLQLLSEYPYNKISDIGSTTYADRKESYPRTSNDSVSVNGINANLPRILERSLTIDSKEDIFASGGTKGLTLIKDNRDNGRDSMVNYITSSYQSGWMFGDIKGAWLSDTVTTTAKTLPLKTSGEEITASDAQVTDRFAISCALNAAGTILAVGAQLEDTAATDAGKVYIYDWNGSTWIERGTITASDAQVSDRFGISCTLDSTGTILAVGSQSEDTAASDAGKMYIYDWNGSVWIERGTIVASDAQANDYFGFSCALNAAGTILAVGAYAEDTAATNAGKVYIYDWNGSAWVERGTITASDAQVSDYFGYSCTLDSTGTILAVGSFAEDTAATNAGKVYIYDWNGSAWVERGTIVASDAQVSDFFGISCALDSTGTILAVGAYAEDTAATDAGKMYIDRKAINALSSASATEADRSFSGSNIAMFGTITKSAVATGADLMGYSGFSAANYIKLSHNNDYELGTDDYCIMGWLNSTAVTSQFLFQISDGTNNGVTEAYISAAESGKIRFVNKDSVTANSSIAYSDFIINTDTWIFVSCIVSDGVMYLYINGELNDSVDAPVNGITNTNSMLSLGSDVNASTNFFSGKLSLWRFSKRAPTKEQIKFIYDNEVELFRDNAECLLNGSNDNVNALNFDKIEDLLYVGTGGSGVTIFDGNKKIGVIDNTGPLTTNIIYGINSCNGVYSIYSNSEVIGFAPEVSLREKLESLDIPVNKDDLVSLTNNSDASNLHRHDFIPETKSVLSATPGSNQDIFVYDTSLDSDGGAWRDRCSHLSWYNEPLNTATRGKSRKFPAVAIIVVDQDNLTIFDATKPNTPMWMKFSTGGTWNTTSNMCGDTSNSIRSVAMKNAKCISGHATFGLMELNFLTEISTFRTSTYHSKYNGNIKERNEGKGHTSNYSSEFIANDNVNDIDITVLPDSAVNPTTNLSEPTIAVATEGGISIIKNDGIVVSILATVGSGFDQADSISFSNDKILYTCDIGFSYNNVPVIRDIPKTDIVNYSLASGATNPANTVNSVASILTDNHWSSYNLVDYKKGVISSNGGLTLIKENISNNLKSMTNFISTTFQSGWMFGDIKGAWLSDTATATAKTLPLKTSGEEITASDAQVSDFFGSSCALNAAGTILAVGAQLEDTAASNAGKVYVYDWNGSAWVERGTIVASDAQSSDQFGISCALDSTGTILAVGANLEDTAATDAGKMYIYDWNGSAWVERGTIVASDAQTSDSFGFSCALDSTGTILAVGAFNEDTGATDAGKVYIYDWNGSAWVERGTITASDAQSFDRFGVSCALDSTGTILAVGAHLEDTATTNAGKMYIYDWNGSAWVERGTIVASDAQSGDQFGVSCALDSTGTILAVGAQAEDTAATDAGKVYIYDWNGSAWVERGTITASDAQSFDSFGISCELDSTGTILAVGAYAEDTAATDAGKMYIDRKAINVLSSASAIEADRSLNNSNIAMFGNVAKAPVAPGADLIRYTNFSSSNYLEQSYNSDLDFGTNDFYIMGWFKGNVDGLVLLDRLGADQHGLLGAATDLTKRIYISGAATNILNVTLGTDTISTSSNAINDNEWSFLTVSKINNYTTLRINGALVAEGATTSTVGDIDHILRLGTGIPWNTSSFEGSMALWRIGNDTPSLDQINYIYNTEKELFSNGAKCTLFNDVPTIPGINNSAISATAIDSRNNKLYAGTAEGINVFDGLLRTDFINENEDIRSLSAINGILALNGLKRSKCKIEEKDLNSELRKAEEKLTKANQGYQKFWNDNLITNGGMDADTDWTKEGTWTISAGVANAVNESATDIFQDIETVIGKRYSLQFEITSYTDGNVRYSIGSFGYVAGGSLNSTGVKKVSFVATSKTTTIRIGGDTAATFSVDNVLVREVDDFDNIIYSVPSGWKPIEVIQQGLYKREGSSQDYIVSDNGFNYWVDPAIDPSLDDEICIVATRI